MKFDLYRPFVPTIDKLYLDRRYERKVEGAENVPDLPALHIANHLRFDDSLLLASTVTHITKRPLRFGAKSELMEGRGIDDQGKYGRSIKLFMKATHMIPVYRDENPRAFQLLNKSAQEAFARGDSVALHAEGTRSKDGRLNRFKTGAARLAMKNLVPVVPEGLTYEPSDDPKRELSTIRFGRPIYPDEYMELSSGDRSPRAIAAALTERLEQDVANLTGQTRSGIDAREEIKGSESADAPRRSY